MAQENQAQAGDLKEGATEVPQGAPDDSLNNPGKETIEARAKSANSPDDVRKLIADATEGRFGQTATEAQAPAEQTEQGAAQNNEKPNGETEMAAGKDGDGAVKPAETKAAEETGKNDEDAFPERIRLTNFSDVDKLALTLKRKDPTLSLAQAEIRAKAALGVKDEPEATAPAPAETGLPKSVSEAEKEIANLTEQRTKAFEEDLDFKAANQLTLKIEALKDHKTTLRDQAQQTATQAQAVYDTAYGEAENKAGAIYDFVNQPDSEAYKRMVEIDRQLQELKDPTYDSPDKPFKIAQMVAREMSIAPKSPTAKAAGVKPAATAPKVIPKTVSPVASGASRTSTPSTQGDGLATKISGLRTQEDLEKFIAGLAR